MKLESTSSHDQLNNSNDDILVTDSVVKKFGGLRAVDDVSIKVKKKLVSLLAGPNGSGKTTLINVISGYYKPDSGRVYFKGEDITGLPMNLIYKRGLVRTFQIPAPFSKMSVLENLLVAYRNNPGESFFKHLNRRYWSNVEKEAIDEALKILQMLGMEDVWDREAWSLGAAQLKLLEIGRALMSKAEALILDEPIAGVNLKVAHEIFSHLNTLRNQLGITFLIIEHRLDVALKYVDHVFVMSEGKIIYDGDPKNVVEDKTVKKIYLGE
ncbi:MAG: ABC transporter ATP-binding protein [Thermoprotei archaeon]